MTFSALGQSLTVLIDQNPNDFVKSRVWFTRCETRLGFSKGCTDQTHLNLTHLR